MTRSPISSSFFSSSTSRQTIHLLSPQTEQNFVILRDLYYSPQLCVPSVYSRVIILYEKFSQMVYTLTNKVSSTQRTVILPTNSIRDTHTRTYKHTRIHVSIRVYVQTRVLSRTHVYLRVCTRTQDTHTLVHVLSRYFLRTRRLPFNVI